MDLNSILVTVLCTLSLIYYLLRKRYNYWADRDIPFVKPTLLVGNTWGLGTKKTNGELMMDHYKELKGKDVIGGIFLLTRPVLLTLDLDLIKHIFVKDFNYFVNRGFYMNKKADPVTNNLLSMEDQDWKDMRKKISPTFSSGKMKLIYEVMANVAVQLADHLLPFAERGEQIEMKDVLLRYTTDIIGNTAFGVECNSIKHPHNEFRRKGDRVFNVSTLALVKTVMLNVFPGIGKAFGIPFFDREATTFFRRSLKETVKYREANDVKRNDFLSLLLQIKKNQKLDDDSTILGPLSIEELAAQVFLFFIAGFETSASTMTWALYELALNQDIQERAREHIRAALEEHNGKMDYECIMSMPYMDQIIYGNKNYLLLVSTC